MEASYLISQPKKQKLNEKEGIDGGSKSIGDLPDAVLQYILSFLPTEDAVRTSILSKRWQYLWTSIPNLDFKEGLRTKRTLFMNYVERVLVLRDFSCIKQFSLSCCVLYDASRINAWISAAVRRNAREFYINLDDIKETCVLPHCLFTSETLEVLELDMSNILKLPSVICLSSLKILTLTNVIFSDDLSTQQLFSGPALEQLSISDCNWVNLKDVIISAPKLWSLTIHETFGHDLSDSIGCQVMIYGNSLKTFDYHGELQNDYILYDSSTVLIAFIDLLCHNVNSRQVALRTNKLLRGLSNVKDLTVSFDAVVILTEAADLLAHVPVFSNLNNLAVYPGPIDLDCISLVKILQNSPCLQTLQFAEGIGLSLFGEKDDGMLDPVPPCFSSHLKSIEVGDFYGNKDELNVVKFLLKNATVLDRMVIDFSEHCRKDLEKKKKIHEQLLELPRGSKSCELVFH